MRALETLRLKLEPQSAAHADAMFMVLGDLAIYEYENAPPASVEWLRTRFARLEARRSADGREQWFNWVVRAADEALIGFVQATVDADNSAQIAYVFGSAHWGRGLASEAVEAVLEELQMRHDIREFRAVLKRCNRRSRRLLEGQRFLSASVTALAAHPVDADELLMTRLRG